MYVGVQCEGKVVPASPRARGTPLQHTHTYLAAHRTAFNLWNFSRLVCMHKAAVSVSQRVFTHASIVHFSIVRAQCGALARAAEAARRDGVAPLSLEPFQPGALCLLLPRHACFVVGHLKVCGVDVSVCMLSDWWVIAMRELCALLSSQVTPTTHNTTQTAHKQHIYITQAPHEQHTNNIAAVATPFIYLCWKATHK